MILRNFVWKIQKTVGQLSELVEVRNDLWNPNPTVTQYPIKVSGDPKKEPKEFIITVYARLVCKIQ